MKVYLNPFRRSIRNVTEKDEAFLHSLGVPYELLWDESELLPILRLMGNTMEVCMGKFDLFNKWVLHSCKREWGKELPDALKMVYLKPNRQCTRCPQFQKCADIHLNFEELEALWQEIYLTKGEMFKK